MTTDARVASAISHWAPRFIANGVPASEFQEVTDGITSWEGWCGAWSVRAKLHEEMGHRALAAGHGFSAGQHLSTAAVCYHFGKFFCP